MDERISGSVHKFGDNINTDIISPPQYMELAVEEAAAYAMNAVDADFSRRVRPGDIMVAGRNFGSGSSRETSPLALKYLGVGAVVSTFFARIFYRNAINVGLPVIECGEAGKIAAGDEIAIDLEAGRIENKTTGASYACGKIPAHLRELVAAGGMFAYLKQRKNSPIYGK